MGIFHITSGARSLQHRCTTPSFSIHIPRFAPSREERGPKIQADFKYDGHTTDTLERNTWLAVFGDQMMHPPWRFRSAADKSRCNIHATLGLACSGCGTTPHVSNVSHAYLWLGNAVSPRLRAVGPLWRCPVRCGGHEGSWSPYRRSLLLVILSRFPPELSQPNYTNGTTTGQRPTHT